MRYINEKPHSNPGLVEEEKLKHLSRNGNSDQVSKQANEPQIKTTRVSLVKYKNRNKSFLLNTVNHCKTQ